MPRTGKVLRWKGRLRPRADSSTPRHCSPAPVWRGGTQGSPRRLCRAAAGPAGPAGIPGRLPPRSAGASTARPGILPDNPPAPAAAPNRPEHRRGSAAPARSRAAPFGAAPRYGTGRAPGPRPGWKDHTGPAERAVRPPRQALPAPWALPECPEHVPAGEAEPDIPVHKSRCAPLAPDSPPPLRSDTRHPPC